jgi:peptidoglycan hydrolase-like protein with peptidoglycan-binding domain
MRFATKMVFAVGAAVLSLAAGAPSALASQSTAARPAASVSPDDGSPTNCNFTTSRPTLRRGSSGAAVKQAQCYLNDSLNPANHTPLAVDGDFGSKTEAAVRAFQTCAHISVDGVVGSDTWAQLKFWADNTSYVC